VLPLLPRRDRPARTADRQHAVTTVRVIEAVGEVVGEVVVADGLARGQRTVAEHQEGLAPPDPLDLARQRLEECRGPNDRVADAGSDQHFLERQLGVLEREHRLLHADRRQQHDLRHARRARRLERVHVRPMIDRPGVAGLAGPRGQARHQCVEALAAKAVAGQRRRVADVAAPDAGPGQQAGGTVRRERAAAACPRPHDAHHLVSAAHERAHGRAADGARRTQHEDTPRVGRHRRAPMLGTGDRSGIEGHGGCSRKSSTVGPR